MDKIKLYNFLTTTGTNDIKSDENQPDGKSEEDQPDGESEFNIISTCLLNTYTCICEYFYLTTYPTALLVVLAYPYCSQFAFYLYKRYHKSSASNRETGGNRHPWNTNGIIFNALVAPWLLPNH